MQTNILKAINNLLDSQMTYVKDDFKGSNRANSMGDALETYIKDLFCNSHNKNDNEKNDLYSDNFSYLGNQNNPPDFMIKGGDAVEVKKIESINSTIALNSSYPKDRLYANSAMITQSCRQCEDWTEKGIIYCIGIVKNNILKGLWFVYGDCYSANKEIYERIANKITSGLHDIEGIELSQTNELGKVKKVDPLGITGLRIRGMWGIENPVKVFNYLKQAQTNGVFFINALMLEEKYTSFPLEDRKNLENKTLENYHLHDVRIKSPNNPAKLLNAKLITFKR
jgi:hypothetical protein